MTEDKAMPENIVAEEQMAVETGVHAPEADISTLAAERDGWKDKAYRAAAEADNVKKRAAADVMEARQYGASRLAADVLNVGDNLARALGVAEGSEKALREGIAMVAGQLEQLLDRHGVKKIGVKKGDALNPDLHQAMSEVETAEVAPGCIVQELQVGFVMNGRLLRPSLVVVAKAPLAKASDAQA